MPNNYDCYLSNENNDSTIENSPTAQAEKQKFIESLGKAFPNIKNEDQLLAGYRESIKNTNQTFSIFRWMWGLWFVYYVFNIIKNLHRKGVIGGGEGAWINHAETTETFVNNLLGATLFWLFYKLTFYKSNDGRVTLIILSSVAFISLTQVVLTFFSNLSPYTISAYFKIFGSVLNGTAFILIFVRLCNKVINPPVYYIIIFTLYGVIQPFVLLNVISEIIVNVPENIKQEKANVMVEDVFGGVTL
jgi:hypothetical protein